MIEIDEARQLIRQHTGQLPAGNVDLALACGHYLAEPVTSDIDSPPFDKSMMDGVAIRFADFESGQREFECVGEIVAGSPCQLSLPGGTVARIMTGAPIPAGADTVVMIEQTRGSAHGGKSMVTITTESCRAGQHVMPRSESMAAGQIVLPAGHRIRPHDVGVLAEAGAAVCKVTGKPRLSIIATGDELVPLNDRPIGSQIRNSNGPMLALMAAPFCSVVRDEGIAGDTVESLRQKIESGLQSDVLILSGGVSAGVADLVPGVLESLGVQPVFHKVAIKPGKPIWFGILPGQPGPAKLVFGLPGNPVSSMCCFHVFVRPAVERLAGGSGNAGYIQAELSGEYCQRAGRTTFWPSLLSWNGRVPKVKPLDWKGSADLLTLSAANCLAVFDGQRDSFPSGETVPVVQLT